MEIKKQKYEFPFNRAWLQYFFYLCCTLTTISTEKMPRAICSKKSFSIYAFKRIFKLMGFP